MKQVISASRRTDIPAFYLPWFIDRIKEKKVAVSNPFNRNQIRQVSLAAADVAWIVFWSRNYHIFIKHRAYFESYRLFFHFTINPPHKFLEPDMIRPDQAFSQLEKLVKYYGPEVIRWRYDPLVFFKHKDQIETNHDMDLFQQFIRFASGLGLRTCTISVAFLYPKVLKRAEKQKNLTFVTPDTDMRNKLLTEMTDVASLYGIQLNSCSNNALLEISGIRQGRCIDGTLLNRLGPDRVSEKSLPTRMDCGCTASVDIGDYVNTTCRYHCLYCYARK